MKVGVYLGDILPTAGGGFTFQDDIVNALLTLDGMSAHEFVILATNPPAALERAKQGRFEFCRISGTLSNKVRRLFGLGFEPFVSALRAMGFPTHLDRRLRTRGIDVLWFATPAFEATDTPYIYTLFDLQHRVLPWFPEVSARGRWLFRENSFAPLLMRANSIITPNRAGQEELERSYGIPPVRTRLLPHPTPSFVLGPADGSGADVLQKFGLEPGYLLYPAQFWAHKNHIAVLHAAQMLRDEHDITVSLVFVGSDRGNRKYVEQVASSLRLTRQLRVQGFVERRELIALYRHAQALVYLSYLGPESLPPLEAFALGCPVIASDVSGAREQLGDAALLVDPANWRQLAQAIMKLRSEERLRTRLIERALSGGPLRTTSAR
jgi:glycosyltransferase involved in cell wall biosynthesis